MKTTYISVKWMHECNMGLVRLGDSSEVCTKEEILKVLETGELPIKNHVLEKGIEPAWVKVARKYNIETLALKREAEAIRKKKREEEANRRKANTPKGKLEASAKKILDTLSLDLG